MDPTCRLTLTATSAVIIVIATVLAGCSQPASDSSPERTAAERAEQSSDTSDASDTNDKQPQAESESAGGVAEAQTVGKQALNATSHGFPPLAALPQVPVPPDNPITSEKVALGRLLFFDERLSGDVGTSCASCHDPRLGWGDGNALSRGYAGTQHWRNSQTVVNAAYLSKLFWAGEAPSLEAQAESAITGNLAGNGDPAMIEERLAQIPEYADRFKKAFGVPRPTFNLVLKAIASFERAETVSADSPFDQYMRGDQATMNESAVRGMKLFQGKAKCIRCHHGPLLTDEGYHNLGVPKNPTFEKDPLRQISLRYQHYIRGVPEHIYRSADRDLGLYYSTKRAQDMGRFRTPPLRYLAYTAPYMHNGVFTTLEQVIDFYVQGGGEDPNRSDLLEPIVLSEDEKFDLLEFLEALSGREIRVFPPQLPPYEPLEEFVAGSARGGTGQHDFQPDTVSLQTSTEPPP